MRPSRTREERKLQVNYIGENELKKELEIQAKEKRAEKLKEKLDEKDQILEHYENFKLESEVGNQDLTNFLSQKKQELIQEKNLFMKTHQNEQIEKPKTKEDERQKRLRLRDEERQRRLQGIQVSAYDVNVPKINPLNMLSEEPKQILPQVKENHKDKIKRELFGEENGEIYGLEFEKRNNNLHANPINTQKFERSKNYGNHISEDEVNLLKETVKMSIDKVLKETIEPQKDPNISTSEKTRNLTKNFTFDKSDSEIDRNGFMLPSMKAQDNKRLQQEKMKMELEQQIREKEAARISNRIKTTKPHIEEERSHQLSAPTSFPNNHKSPFFTQNDFHPPQQADFNDFWPSKKSQEEISNAEIDKKKQYQQDLLQQIQDKNRAKTVQENQRKFQETDSNFTENQKNFRATINFPQNLPNSANEAKKEYREALRIQIEEKKERDKRERELLLQKEFEEEMKAKKEFENLQNNQKAKLSKSNSQAFQTQDSKEKIKNSLFGNLNENSNNMQFHNFGEVIKPTLITQKEDLFQPEDTKGENLQRMKLQSKYEDEEAVRSYEREVTSQLQHHNQIRNSHFFNQNEKISALYESSINCRGLLEELRQERERMKRVSSDQIHSIENMIQEILNEKDQLEFEICSLRSKLDVNKLETGIDLNLKNTIQSLDNQLPSKSDYILYPNSEDLLKESYLKQLELFKQFQRNNFEAESIKKEIVVEEKKIHLLQTKISNTSLKQMSQGSANNSFGDDHVLVESKSSFTHKPETSSHFKSTLGKFKESNFEPIPEHEEFKDLSNNKDNSNSIIISNSVAETSLHRQTSDKSKGRGTQEFKSDNFHLLKNENSLIGVNPLDSQINNFSKLSDDRALHSENQIENQNFQDSQDCVSQSFKVSKAERLECRTFPTRDSEMEPRPELKNLDQKTLSQRIDEVIPKDLANCLINTNDYSYLWKKRYKFTDSESDHGQSNESLSDMNGEFNDNKEIFNHDNSSIIDCQSMMIDESKDFGNNLKNPFHYEKSQIKEETKGRLDSAKVYSKPKIVDVFGKMNGKKNKTSNLDSEKILNRLERFISDSDKNDQRILSK